MVVLGGELEVSVDLSLAREVLELGGVGERVGDGALVLDLQHAAQTHVHLVDQVDVQLAQEVLATKERCLVYFCFIFRGICICIIFNEHQITKYRM